MIFIYFSIIFFLILSYNVFCFVILFDFCLSFRYVILLPFHLNCMKIKIIFFDFLGLQIIQVIYTVLKVRKNNSEEHSEKIG